VLDGGHCPLFLVFIVEQNLVGIDAAVSTVSPLRNTQNALYNPLCESSHKTGSKKRIATPPWRRNERQHRYNIMHTIARVLGTRGCERTDGQTDIILDTSHRSRGGGEIKKNQRQRSKKHAIPRIFTQLSCGHECTGCRR